MMFFGVCFMIYFIRLTSGKAPLDSKVEDEYMKHEAATIPDRYVIFLLDNELERTAKVSSNKGKLKNKVYVIEPRSYLQVNITIKGKNNSKPILFRGEDQETEMYLLLNNSTLPLSLTPSTTPSYITKVSITAEAPDVKPIQSWSLLCFNGTMVKGSPSLLGHGKIGETDGGLHFDGATSSMDAYIERSHCLHNTEMCDKGFSFGTKLKVDSRTTGFTEPKFILDSGGHGKNTRGVSLYIENSKLVVEVTTADKKFKTSTALIIDQWIYVIVTFKKNQGLLLYYDTTLHNTDNIGLPVSHTRPVETFRNLVIGRSIEGPPYHYAAFDMASLTIFPKYLKKVMWRRRF